MKFSRQEHWSGLPPPSAGDLPDPEIEPGSPASHADSLFGKLNRDLNSIPLRMEACSLKGMTVPAFSEGHARPECCLGAGQVATHPQVKPRHPCTRDGRALSPLYEGWESPATPVRGMGEPRHPRTRDGTALPPPYEEWESPLGTAKQAQQAQRTTGRRPPRPGPTAANTGSGKTCVCNAVGALRCSQVRYTQNLNKRLAVT